MPPTHARPRRPLRDAVLADLLSAGLSSAFVGSALGMNPSLVRRFARRAGAAVPPRVKVTTGFDPAPWTRLTARQVNHWRRSVVVRAALQRHTPDQVAAALGLSARSVRTVAAAAGAGPGQSGDS